MSSGTVDGASWEIHGRRIVVRDRFGRVDVSGAIAGLWMERLTAWGRVDAAAALLAARFVWADTPEGRAGVIVGRPVWGAEAGPGACHGCGDECAASERHYYALPDTGTLALCLACGPEENYAELAREDVARCEACSAELSWADCSYGHDDCYQTECDTPLGCGHVSRDCEDMAEGVAA